MFSLVEKSICSYHYEMKIAFFIENYYKGGLDTFLINLINHWPAQDDDLVIFCNKSHPGISMYLGHIRYKKMKLYSHSFAHFSNDFRNNRSFPKRILQWLIKSISILMNFLSCYRRFKHMRLDRLMVVNGGYPAGLTCRAAMIAWRLAGRNPLAIHNFHNDPMPSQKFDFLSMLIDYWVATSASCFVTVSKNCAQSMSIRKIISKHAKITYIHNGVEDIRLKSSGASSKRSDQTVRCVMLGTFEERKGHRYLLEAFHKALLLYPDMQLDIYGFGFPEERMSIEQVISLLELEASVCVHHFESNVVNIYDRADIVLISSQCYESFGLVAAESMAMGLPVVSTSVGGLPEVIQNEVTGFCHDKDDVSDFAASIVKLAKSKELRNQMGGAGRRRYELMFSAQRMAREYYSLIVHDRTTFSSNCAKQ